MTKPIADLIQRYEREWPCPHCGVIYKSCFGRVTCGEDVCIQAEVKRMGINDFFTPKSSTSKAHVEVALRAVGVPTPYISASIHDFDDADYSWQTRKSVYIHGGNGRGKTHLAVGMLKAARTLGASVRFTSASKYLKAVVATYRRNSTESEADVLADHADPDVLVLDDLGAQRVGDFGLSELLTLIEERSWRSKTTVITSNLTPAELHGNEPRLASRVKEWRIVKLGGMDRRMPEVNDPHRKD